MGRRYDSVNDSVVSDEYDKYGRLFCDDGLGGQYGSEIEYLMAFWDVTGNLDLFRKQPQIALNSSAEALATTTRIIGKSQNRGGSGETREDEIIDSVTNVLNDPNATMTDIGQLSSYIEVQRHEIKIQTLELEQIFAGLQVKYARLIMLKHEHNAMELNAYTSAIEKISGGRPLATIQSYRQSMFGTDVSTEY